MGKKMRISKDKDFSRKMFNPHFLGSYSTYFSWYNVVHLEMRFCQTETLDSKLSSPVTLGPELNIY